MSDQKTVLKHLRETKERLLAMPIDELKQLLEESKQHLDADPALREFFDGAAQSLKAPVFELGEVVHDDLTGIKAIIVRIDTSQSGFIGYYIDNDYLGGARHAWELTKR